MWQRARSDFSVHGSRKLCQWGSNLNNVFLFFFFLRCVGERIDPNTTISGISTAAAGGPVLNDGSVSLRFKGSEPVLLKKPIFL